MLEKSRWEKVLFSLPYKNYYFTSSYCFLSLHFEPRKIATKNFDFVAFHASSYVKVFFEFSVFLFAVLLKM